MPFADEVRDWSLKVGARAREVFVGTATAVLGSIKEGSAITAAPGQPVDTRNLINSWQLWFPSATEAVIATDVVYAPPIEDGIGRYGPLTLRSKVGGFHSVKLTVAGFERLVEAEVAKVAPNG